MESDKESGSKVKSAFVKYVVIPVATIASVGTLSGCDYSKVAENVGNWFRKAGNVAEHTISNIPEIANDLEEKITREVRYLAPSMDPTLKEPLYLEFEGGMPSYVRDELVKQDGFLETICGKNPRNAIAAANKLLENKVVIYSVGKDANGNNILKEDTWNNDEVFEILKSRFSNDEVYPKIVRILVGMDSSNHLNFYIEYDFDNADGINPYIVGNSEFDNKVTHLEFMNEIYGAEAHRTLKSFVDSYK